MTEHQVSRKLDFSRKILLSTAGLAAIAVPVVFGLLNSIPSRAQSRAEDTTANAPTFEVASIKPNKSGNGFTGLGFFSADTFHASGATVQRLIREAYDIGDNQILGAPHWVESEEYDIEAKVDKFVAEELQKLSGDQETLEEHRLLQALLADRFGLTLHRETKDLPVYALVIAKNGPKLHEAKPGDTYPNSPIPPDLNNKTHGNIMMVGRGMLTGQGIPIASLVRMLAQQPLGRVVLDKTGPTGNYDFTLKWTPDATPGPTESQQRTDTTSPPDSGISIFTAIQEQLGLKLEPQKGPVEVLVIDHVEKPSEN